MNQKRKTKNDKRKSKKAALDENRRRRQQRLAAPLETQKAARHISEVNEFFDGYWLHPDPDRLQRIMGLIDELNLLRLDEFKHGTAAAIVAVLRQHPAEEANWLKQPWGVGPLNSAKRLCPEPEDGTWRITEPHHVDQIGAQFGVSGDTLFLDALYDEARDPNSAFGDEASHLLGYYVNVSETAARWADELPQKKRRATPLAVEKPFKKLVKKIMNLPDNYRVAAFTWDPGSSELVIATHDEGPLKGAPDSVDGYRVRTRIATEEEVQAHADWERHNEVPM